MNFTSLRNFLIVAEEKNITHAAEKLFISQQALSKSIMNLEKELGVSLFHRARDLELTYAGRKLQQYASSIIQMEHEMRQIANDVNNSLTGELRLGISHTCGRAILPFLLPRYHKAHPGIQLYLQEGNSLELEYSLQQGNLDLVIGFSPIGSETIKETHLMDERLFLVVPPNLMQEYFGSKADQIRRKSHQKLDLSLFTNIPFIALKKGNRLRTMIDQYGEKIGFQPNILLETENTETAFALAQSGMGITIYPELFRMRIPHSLEVYGHVDFFPIQDETTTGRLVIAWEESRYQSRPVKDFVKQCKEDMEAFRKLVSP